MRKNFIVCYNVKAKLNYEYYEYEYEYVRKKVFFVYCRVVALFYYVYSVVIHNFVWPMIDECEWLLYWNLTVRCAVCFINFSYIMRTRQERNWNRIPFRKCQKVLFIKHEIQYIKNLLRIYCIIDINMLY
jgi:hypothetical protein